MATTRTRKRARNDDGEFMPDDPTTPDVNEAYEQGLPLDVDSLAAFMEVQQPDRERLGLALQLASDAAALAIGRPIAAAEIHAVRHGIHLLAAELLLKDRLEGPPAPADIPAVVRAFWTLAG